MSMNCAMDDEISLSLFISYEMLCRRLEIFLHLSLLRGAERGPEGSDLLRFRT